MNKKNDKNNIKGLLEDSPVFSDISEVDKLYDMLLRTLQELTVLQEELFAIKLALKKIILKLMKSLMILVIIQPILKPLLSNIRK